MNEIQVFFTIYGKFHETSNFFVSIYRKHLSKVC